ncbi:hypothetical protein WH52_04130 [Tenacibaculum holothuriorum]|uniref:Uncharacterized protein n=1 Tax=Tenacibaculum holothuriorum TaxID=1635173 RepID=A0A1Y2PGQ3_9FLAO|nr:hypothetical protein [Tenacibaculum holothuriorum]OSY88858.1 hypothetical protein WH52_04130 [Tenacibaculum holothuriorum]
MKVNEPLVIIFAFNLSLESHFSNFPEKFPERVVSSFLETISVKLLVALQEELPTVTPPYV